MLVDVLDSGKPGGILVEPLFGEEMRRMVDEPEHRRRSTRACRTSTATWRSPRRVLVKAALELIGWRSGRPRLPYVALDEPELSVVRAMLERHGLLATQREPARRHSPASRPAGGDSR